MEKMGEIFGRSFPLIPLMCYSTGMHIMLHDNINETTTRHKNSQKLSQQYSNTNIIIQSKNILTKRIEYAVLERNQLCTSTMVSAKQLLR